ncbi:hypothetical protein [Cupriavidus taiwanensis]|uniref:Uncharacterized protein n=1 Tax=Cupriavidus taiwanensis (strain DSM 17343 / BCRC 17206 / CCUG 44338 / CIP 107171 / LMG 19424 / R1) TaxID=977880 RepID=B3R9J4_CUPTR|nr:hypothetical protein [Cupriavidus taiwanensis]CAQ71569.1 hypothetical protein RALTA_B0958 [Cupriavidus taiwanensis LMG 19424]
MTKKQTEQTTEEKKRYSYFLRPAAQDKLFALAKKHALPVGDALEVILDNLDEAAVGAKLDEYRRGKSQKRGEKSELFKKFQTLTPEQLAMLEKLG